MCGRAVSRKEESEKSILEGLYEQRNMEIRKYALPAACGDGKLCEAGRTAEYSYCRLGGHDLQYSGYGVNFGPAGTVFLQYHPRDGRICNESDDEKTGAGG